MKHHRRPESVQDEVDHRGQCHRPQTPTTTPHNDRLCFRAETGLVWRGPGTARQGWSLCLFCGGLVRLTLCAAGLSQYTANSIASQQADHRLSSSPGQVLYHKPFFFLPWTLGSLPDPYVAPKVLPCSSGYICEPEIPGVRGTEEYLTSSLTTVPSLSHDFSLFPKKHPPVLLSSSAACHPFSFTFATSCASYRRQRRTRRGHKTIGYHSPRGAMLEENNSQYK